MDTKSNADPSEGIDCSGRCVLWLNSATRVEILHLNNRRIPQQHRHPGGNYSRAGTEIDQGLTFPGGVPTAHRRCAGADGQEHGDYPRRSYARANHTDDADVFDTTGKKYSAPFELTVDRRMEIVASRRG